MANEKIVNLKGSDGNYVHPVTSGKAVKMDGDKDLDTVFREKAEELKQEYDGTVTQVQQFFAGLTATLQQDYNQKVASLEQKQVAWESAHSGYREFSSFESGDAVPVANGQTAVIQLPSSELGHLMVTRCKGKILYTGSSSTSRHTVQVKVPEDGVYIFFTSVAIRFPSPRDSSTDYRTVIIPNGVHNPGEVFESEDQIAIGAGGANARESGFDFSIVALRIV